MQYVLLLITDNQDSIIGFDAMITEDRAYNNSVIKYNNSKLETRVIDSENKDTFFRIVDFLTYETDVKLLNILSKEGLLK